MTRLKDDEKFRLNRRMEILSKYNEQVRLIEKLAKTQYNKKDPENEAELLRVNLNYS
jgi:hypothetical protein